jgi:micrococcal nuclease
MQRRLRLLLAAVLLATLAVVFARAREGPARPLAGGVVARVVDGDTIVVRAGSTDEDVRLIGLDTPETVDPRRPVGCYGPEASAYAKRLLSGRRVRLAYDRELRDRYGRYLAYVYLDRDPALFVNARLLAEGFARTLAIPPNTRYADRFAALERDASIAGRGLWSACASG